MGAGEKTINFFRTIADPAKGAANLPLVVSLRIWSLLNILFPAVIITLAVILRPWKISAYRGHQMEIGMWTICRITSRQNTCFDDWYKQNPIYWVYIWRGFLVAPIAIQFLTFLYVTIEVSRKKVNSFFHWTVASMASLLSAFCGMASLIVFYAKFEWEWAEQPFGWEIMGWTEETPDKSGYTEPPGFPYIMAWVGVITLVIGSYFCFYTRSQEIVLQSEIKILNQKKKLLQQF